jgi:hypothetical protein
LCALALLFATWGPAWPQDKVKLKLTRPEGHVATYKNACQVEYFSDMGEWILPGRQARDDLQVIINQQWKSREEAAQGPPGPGDPGAGEVQALLEKSDSGVIIDGHPLIPFEFPHTMDLLKGKGFSWNLAPGGRAGTFRPMEGDYHGIRPGMVTDLQQCWMPELYPVLPEGPVGPGDTWTAHQTFRATYGEIGREGLVDIESTYKVKKIKEKKGALEVEIEEKRKIQYIGWMFAGRLSLLLGGEGQGTAKWKINTATNQVVSHEARMEIERPAVRLAESGQPIGGVKAELSWRFKRKLEKWKEK